MCPRFWEARIHSKSARQALPQKPRQRYDPAAQIYIPGLLGKPCCRNPRTHTPQNMFRKLPPNIFDMSCALNTKLVLTRHAVGEKSNQDLRTCVVLPLTPSICSLITARPNSKRTWGGEDIQSQPPFLPKMSAMSPLDRETIQCQFAISFEHVSRHWKVETLSYCCGVVQWPIGRPCYYPPLAEKTQMLTCEPDNNSGPVAAPLLSRADTCAPGWVHITWPEYPRHNNRSWHKFDNEWSSDSPPIVCGC